jgi:hypothetical protein
VIREAAKKTEETEAKPSQDQPQKSDVGSSSDSSKIVEIPANFRHIGGNTELAKAQVILLGEYHIPQHNKDIVDFINAHAKDGDIVLVEGVQAGTKLGKREYMVKKALTLVDLTEFEVKQESKQLKLKDVFQEGAKRGIIIPFLKNVKIYGWDDIEANDELALYLMKLTN